MYYHLDIPWILNSIISFGEYSHLLNGKSHINIKWGGIKMIKNNRKYLDFAKKTSLGLNTNMSSMTFASVDHFNERFSPLFGSRRIFKSRKNA